MIKHTGGIVQNQAVNFPGADNDLEGVAEGMGSRDQRRDNEAQWSPDELEAISVKSASYASFLVAHSCHRFHAQDKWIRGQIPGVGQGIFFPELAKQILRWPHAHMIQGKVP